MTGDPSYPYPWNPAYPFDELKALFDRYNIICGIGRDHHFNPDIRMGLELGWGASSASLNVIALKMVPKLMSSMTAKSPWSRQSSAFCAGSPASWRNSR